MPPTETPDPPTVEPAQHLAPTDVTYEARMLWPYLTGWHAGQGVAANGRELGCWIAGHLGGRRMHGEPGLRVEVPLPCVAGVCAVLLEFGLIVQRYSSSDRGDAVTLDVWAY